MSEKSKDKRPDTLSLREIRQGVRAKGIPVHLSLARARRKCRRLARKDGIPHWVFYEEYGFVTLNLDSIQLYNHAFMKNGLKKIRVREMDSLCVFRHPKIGKVK